MRDDVRKEIEERGKLNLRIQHVRLVAVRPSRELVLER